MKTEQNQKLRFYNFFSMLKRGSHIDTNGSSGFVLSRLLIALILLSTVQSLAQPSPKPNELEPQKTKLNGDAAPHSTSTTSTKSVKITLYPQHDQVELLDSKQIIDSWSLFFGEVSGHLSKERSTQVLESFLNWKRSQDLFSEIEALEMLQTSLADHLLVLSQTEGFDELRLSERDKLQTALNRLNTQKEHLERDDGWREQQELLSTKLNPLKELAQAEQALKESLDLAVADFDQEVKRQLDELTNFEGDLDEPTETSGSEFKPINENKDLNKSLLHNGSVLEAVFEGDQVLDEALERELNEEYIELQKERSHELEASLSALKLFHESIKTREDRLKRCVQSLERLISDSADKLRELTSLREQNQALLHRVTLWNSYWETREQLKRRHEGSSREGLLSHISGQKNPLKERWKALKEVDLELESQVESFQTTHIKPLEASQPPEIEELKKQTPFHRAKHSHDSAKRFLAFHNTRQTTLRETILKGEALLKDVDALQKKLRLNWEDFIEHDVLTAKLQREEPIKISVLNIEQIIERALERGSERRLRKMILMRVRWDRYRDQLTHKLESWGETLRDDESSIDRIDKELHSEGGLVDRLKLESSWLEFIKEIETLSGEQLLTKHQDALAIYTEQETAIKAMRAEYKLLLTRYQEVWSKLREQSDPLLRQYRTDSHAFLSYVEDLLPLINDTPSEHHPEGHIGTEGLNNQPQSQKDTDSSPNSDQGDDKKQRDLAPLEATDPSLFNIASQSGLSGQMSHHHTVSKVSKLSRYLRDLLPPRITFYLQYSQTVTELKDLLARRQSLILSLQGEFAKRVEYARQVRRTASVIRQRVLENELSNEVMTEEIENHGQREWVEQLRAESLDDLKSALDYDQHKLSLEPDFNKLREQIHKWRQLLNDILDLSNRQVRLITEAVEAENTSVAIQSKDLSAQQGVEQHKTLNERQFEHLLHLRMEEDSPWYDGLWTSFTNDDIVNLEELLREHYVELLKTESAQNNLEDQIKLTKALADSVSAQRPILELYQLALNDVTNRISDRLDRYTDEFGVRLDHQETVKRLRLKSSSSSAHLDYLLLTALKTEGEKRAKLEELEQLWAMKKVYQAVTIELNERLAPQGLLEEITGEVQDAISQLETERDELNRPLIRLLGSRARGVDLTQEMPRLGEIDRLHEERIRMKLRVLFLSLLSFLLIPLVTFLALRALGSIETRIRKLSEKELERLIAEGELQTRQKRAEREDRLATLLQVMRTTSKLLIFTVATGAMLKTLHVDVTPIIASAGIIGLAFAFGAQELVKDFFAGIFILFENQYNRGDFVTINGIFGCIDKITLRITVIRDSHGVIHFIPNGQVQVVSNHNKEWSQAHLEIGASYNNPPKQVIDCLRTLCKEVAADPVIGEDILGWEVLGLERFDDSAVIYRVHLKTAPKEKWRVARHYRKRVMEVFATQGIEIPFPQVVVTHPSTLTSESEQS